LNKGILFTALVVLSGCGLNLDAVREAVSVSGAKAMDDVLNDAEFIICKGVSVGAKERKYPRGSAKAKAYDTLCDRDLEEDK